MDEKSEKVIMFEEACKSAGLTEAETQEFRAYCRDQYIMLAWMTREEIIEQAKVWDDRWYKHLT